MLHAPAAKWALHDAEHIGDFPHRDAMPGAREMFADGSAVGQERRLQSTVVSSQTVV